MGMTSQGVADRFDFPRRFAKIAGLHYIEISKIRKRR
jgi:hypothetical protein